MHESAIEARTERSHARRRLARAEGRMLSTMTTQEMQLLHERLTEALESTTKAIDLRVLRGGGGGGPR